MENVFGPEKFKLVETEPEFTFYPEVASDIANAVYDNDGGSYNHNHASDFIGHEIEVSVGGPEPAPYDGRATRHTTPRIVIPEDIEIEALANVVFARNFQRALDEREYSNRMSIPGSIGLITLIDSIPGGFVLGALGQDGVSKNDVLIAAGAGVALGTVAGGSYHTVRNIHRKIVTNPKNKNINGAHLNRAARLAEKLDLAPVLTTS